MTDFTRLPLRDRVSDTDIAPMIGKILTDNEYDFLVTGPTHATIPNGSGGKKDLLKYIPRAFAEEEMTSFYDVLHELRTYETTNRGNASGTERQKAFEDSTWTYSKPVASAIIGAFDAAPPKNYCRLTAFTAKETEKFASLFPMFQKVGRLFAEHVPDRYDVQAKFAAETDPDWVIPGTPFSTATVNNSYPTGVHTDKGDLDEGFSTLVTLRRGTYRGGRLVFPQWRVAVDMQDGDLLLMDAHQYHGNTTLEMLDPECYIAHEELTKATVRAHLWVGGKMRDRDLCETHGALLGAEGAPNLSFEDIVPAERISTVLYYRTKMKLCGDSQTEFQRAEEWSEKKIAMGASLVEEQAQEAASVA